MVLPWFRRLFRRSPATPNVRAEADNGNAEAQFSLGLRLAGGIGTDSDYRQAARWYLLAANQNHSLAQFNLGMMLANGQGMPRDEAEALIWIGRAAQQGDAAAQHQLGLRQRRACLTGPTQEASEANLEAYKWFRLAASQGYRGSEAEVDGIALGMTREEVTEGNQRAADFTAASPVLAPSPKPPEQD